MRRQGEATPDPGGSIVIKTQVKQHRSQSAGDRSSAGRTTHTLGKATASVFPAAEIEDSDISLAAISLSVDSRRPLTAGGAPFSHGPFPGQPLFPTTIPLNPMRRTAWLAASLATMAGSLSLPLLAPAAQAQSDSEAKIEARIGAWGRNCKNELAAKFKAPSMADVEVSLSASLRAGIDAGEVTLADIKRSGLSFDYRVHHVPGKDPEGYCNTDGQGNVDEIRNMHD